MKNFHIYVISLVEEIDRRRSISDQLDRMNLDWSFFDAISYKKTDVKICWGEEALKDAHIRLGRELTVGEIACSESHFKLYKAISDAPHDIAIVLEDDAIIGSQFIKFIQALTDLEGFMYDVLILGYSKLSTIKEQRFYKFEPIKSTIDINGVKVGPVWREWTCGTVGYVLSKNAAMKMVAGRRLYTIADDWRSLKVYYRLVIFHCRPLLIHENFIDFESAIENDRSRLLKPYRAYLDWLRFIRGFIRYSIMKFC